MHFTNGDILVIINVLGWTWHFVSSHIKNKKALDTTVSAVVKEVRNAAPEVTNFTNDVIDGIKHLVQMPVVAAKVAPVKLEAHKLESDLLNAKLISAAAIAFHGLQKKLDELSDADKLAFVEFVRSMVPNGASISNDQIIGAINEVQKMADEAAKNPLFERAAALTDVIEKFRGTNVPSTSENASEAKSEPADAVAQA